MIYLDNNATTAVSKGVLKSLEHTLSAYYGNPSSLHHLGQLSYQKIDEVRHLIADRIGCRPDEILFTSSGSEANNLCLKGYAFANRAKGNHIITSKIEHPSILSCCAYLEQQGFRVTYLDVDHEGFVDPKALQMSLSSETILISIAHANNEIGTIQPIEALSEVNSEIPFHTDAVQSFLKVDLNVKRLNLSLASFSAHKFHGPKGVGFVYKKKNTKLNPETLGGQQEMGLRAGTENVWGILAMGEAIREFLPEHVALMKERQAYMIQELLSIPGVRLNGPSDLTKRLCSNINISFDSLEGEEIVRSLSSHNIFVSTGSACSSKHARTSHVLKAIKCPAKYIQGSVRIGISRYTTKKEIDLFLKAFSTLIAESNSPFRLRA